MLNKQQEYAYNTLMSGKNCFLTGEAGVGKSCVLNKFIEDSKEAGKNIIVTAPTGIAAINVSGVTLHRAFRIPLKPLVEGVKKIPETIEKADIVVIEEISMCRIDVFDFVAQIILVINIKRQKYENRKPIQLIVCGDFFQLPPVLMDKDKELLESYYGRPLNRGFAFQSELWKYFNFYNILLTDVVRQDNPDFVKALNMTRVGDASALDYFWQNSSSFMISKAIMLCGTNKAANERNMSELANLKTPEYVFVSTTIGDVRDSDKIVEDRLGLKVGARVMTVMNDSEDRYQNGSLGTVVKLEPDCVFVEIDNSGMVVEINRYTWDICTYTLVDGVVKQTVVGSYIQFPLKLAYAITIHKSQGQTYDAVNLNPYCWDCGQLYVALSRVRNIDKLFLTQYPSRNFLVTSREVLDFYKNLNNK